MNRSQRRKADRKIQRLIRDDRQFAADFSALERFGRGEASEADYEGAARVLIASAGLKSSTAAVAQRVRFIDRLIKGGAIDLDLPE